MCVHGAVGDCPALPWMHFSQKKSGLPCSSLQRVHARRIPAEVLAQYAHAQPPSGTTSPEPMECQRTIGHVSALIGSGRGRGRGCKVGALGAGRQTDPRLVSGRYAVDWIIPFTAPESSIGTRFSEGCPDMPGTKSSGGTMFPERSTVVLEEGVLRPNSVHGIMKWSETVE